MRYYKYVGSASLAKEYFDPQPVVGIIYKGTDQAGSDTVEYWADKVVDEWKEVSEEEYQNQFLTKGDGEKYKVGGEEIHVKIEELIEKERLTPMEEGQISAYREYLKCKEPDKVSPSHYKQGKVECIEAIESGVINKSGFEGALVGNVIKYLWRYEEKGDKLTDIKKALWYLTKLKDHVESND